MYTLRGTHARQNKVIYNTHAILYKIIGTFYDR